MAYQTATATDTTDLLDKVRLFLIAQGWTVDRWADRAGGVGKVLNVHLGALFFTFLSDNTLNPTTANPGPYITVYQHPAYSGAALDTQASQSLGQVANRMLGPYQAYHFFAGTGDSGPFFHAVVETDPGSFKHFGIGVLNKQGAVTNAAYCYASSWSYHPAWTSIADDIRHAMPFDDLTRTNSGAASRGLAVRADYDAISPRYHYADFSDTATALFVGYRNGTIRGPAIAGASELTGRAPLLPLWCGVQRGSGLYSDVGYPPELRFVRVDDFEPGQELPIGGDTWLVFPAMRKTGAAGNPNSGGYGLAYRKVA